MPYPPLTRARRRRARLAAQRLLVSVALALLATPGGVAAAPGDGAPAAAPASPASWGLTGRVGVEASAYLDSDATQVFTPVVFGGVASPLGGWKVNGSLLFDVVTTASADVVAGASPRWTEVRAAGAVSGSKTFGDVQATMRGAFSKESDYVSIAAGAGVAVGLFNKNWTPSLSYDFERDTVGRSGTSFDVFSHAVTKHTLDAGLEIVADRATIVQPMFTAVIEHGDSSKPYRLVPLFGAGTELPAGAPASAQVGRAGKVIEALPGERLRFALTLRLLHRFAQSTLRAEERLYADSWGLSASSTDLRYLVDVSPALRIGPHLRFHAQSGAAFWRRFYLLTGSTEDRSVPAYRSGDRELGPLYAATLGFGARVSLGKRLSLAPSLDGIYTRFLDALLIQHRVAALGSLTFEAEFE